MSKDSLETGIESQGNRIINKAKESQFKYNIHYTFVTS